jgi:uncharacterized membrane protein YedE/YeeE
MFPSAEIMLGLHIWLARLPVAQPVNPPPALVFSGQQFFIALIAGVVMAFAFQFLLTNFSLAAKISDWDNSVELDVDDESESWGSKIRQIESKVGFWTLLTVNIAIFIACFLAVKLSLINSTGLGAITGVVIWSVYFLVLVWVSSSAVGSLVGSVVSAGSSGLQGVMATAATALGGRAVNQQIVNTVEASVASVRRELSSAVDPSSLRETVQEYLQDLQLPKLDFKGIQSELENLLHSSDLKSLAGSDILSNVDRQTFVDLISSRTDLSKADVDRLADRLEGVWQQVVGQQPQKDPTTQAIDFLKSATPEDLTSSDLIAKLGQSLGIGQDGDKQSSGMMNQALTLGFNALVGTVLSRTDLSDLDVEKVLGQLQNLKEQAKQVGSKVADKLPNIGFNPIQADVENYILNSQPWHLNRETIKQEFKDVIYDVESAPGVIRPLLEQMSRDTFVELLNQRGNFTSEQVEEIAEQLEGIRTEVLETVKNAESEEQSQDIRSRVENYLRSTGKEELNPEGIKRDFTALLEDPEAGVDVLKSRLSQFDRDTLVQLLGQREDFSPEEAEQLINQLEATRDGVGQQAQELQEQAKSKTEELRNQVESYLRDTNKEELNPDAIKQEFQTLLEDPQAGLKALRERLSQFDRDTLVQLLKQRGDISEEQINQIVDQIEAVRDNIVQAPQQLADKAQEQYEQFTSKISDYLQNTNLEELDPEGIKQDLAKLLEDPKEGALALRQRLSQVDRETLVKLLSQREDLSEEQVNKIVDRLQESIRGIVKAPRRLASRAKDKVQDFQADLENYLRNTNKEELNPEGIKRDLQLLLKEPKAGIQNLGERLSQVDRSTLVSLLSQREDISEEEANRIAEQIETARNSLVEQVQNVQEKVRTALDGTFDKIRNYLNSLERPELNYEGIKRDFRKLFDDPQAGFDSVKERLSQFDRNTLVALLSSRNDISEADANHIIDQVEKARDNVLTKAERLQKETQKRIKDLKHKAKKQGEETRKAAATAAWWLFGTATTSVLSAAIAGAIAVAGRLG